MVQVQAHDNYKSVIFMWKVKASPTELSNSEGLLLKCVGGTNWELKAGVLPSKEKLHEGFTLFHDTIAAEGFEYINSIHDFCLEESVDRVNFAMKRMREETHDMDISIKSGDGETIIYLQQIVDKVTAVKYQSWLDGNEKVPYWLYRVLRAAFNEKVMYEYELKI